MEEAAKAVAGLSATIFSPAKMVYIAYVALLVAKIRGPSAWEFLLVSAFFLVVEIGHNDWLRIRLNSCAEKKKQDSEKPEWFVKLKND